MIPLVLTGSVKAGLMGDGLPVCAQNRVGPGCDIDVAGFAVSRNVVRDLWACRCESAQPISTGVKLFDGMAFPAVYECGRGGSCALAET